MLQPDSDADVIGLLPAAADRANRFLAFDASGNPFAATAVTGTPVSAFMATMLDDTSAADARATLGIVDQAAYVGLSNWHNCR
jgi:hypothetical protein